MKNRKPLKLLPRIAFQELSSRWGVMMVTNISLTLSFNVGSDQICSTCCTSYRKSVSDKKQPAIVNIYAVSS